MGGETPTTPTAPAVEQRQHTLPFILGGLFLVFIVIIGGYFLFANKKNQPSIQQNQTAHVSPSPFSKITTSPTSDMKIPQDWTLKTSKECNVQIPLPPKKPPYYTPSHVTPPAGDAGKYWQFLESEAPSDKPTAREYTDIVYVVMRADDEMGSGYVAGNVYIQCGKNTNNYTTQDLVTLYEKPFVNGSNHGLVIKKKETRTLWGKQVIAVSMEGGMYDSGLTVYFLATNSHIYQISKVAMSTDPLIKKTTEQIFDFIRFN